MKKIAALLLLLAMSVAMFAGCGGEKTPAPVDPVDPGVVDPTPVDPVDPVDPTPVDPVDPVDPTPVDPVDPTPADPSDTQEVYYEPISYEDIFFSIGSVVPSKIDLIVDGFNKPTAAAKKGIKADAGADGQVTVGGYGATTTVTFNTETKRLAIEVVNVYIGAVYNGADLATGPVCTVEYRDAYWTKYENVANPKKIADGVIVNYTLNKGVVTILGAARFDTKVITKINKNAEGKIETVVLGGTEYYVNATATGFGQTIEQELVVGQKYNVWFDTNNNVGFARVFA